MKIGFFDTGLGGATILKEAINRINAEFIYLADNKNAPYGLKDENTVKKLTEENINKLKDFGCKIIVIACNTATSASIEYLRNKYKNILLIGTEPAIKPALQNSNNKKIILTATSLTLNGDKLSKLIINIGGKDRFAFLPLDKLVEYADFTEEIEYNLAYEYLKEKFLSFDLNMYSGIVLGCTHFPIFKSQFKKILPEHIKIYDSAVGVVDNLKTKIDKELNFDNNYNNIELVLTEENKLFRDKFFNFINER